MFKKTLFLFIATLPICFGQSVNESAFKNAIANLTSTERNERLLEIGEKFLGLPYLGGTLESSKEALICRLDGFDCYTFVETVLALTLTSEENQPNQAIFNNKMQHLRYRNGEIDGYASRIHYFFEWAKLAEAKGTVTDLTPALGVARPKTINFMSTHRQYYPSFKTNNTVWSEIKTMELDVDKYKFHEIKKADFHKVQSEIKNGDILAFTSTIKGLDVNHEGFAYWKGDKLHFLHASSEKKKIVISDETLQAYMNRIKKHAGLMVLRVL